MRVRTKSQENPNSSSALQAFSLGAGTPKRATRPASVDGLFEKRAAGGFVHRGERAYPAAARFGGGTRHAVAGELPVAVAREHVTVPGERGEDFGPADSVCSCVELGQLAEGWR